MKWVYCFLFICINGIAQDPPPVIQQQLEELSENKETEEIEDDSQLLQWDYLKKHPLNINTASGEELKTLNFLHELQVFHLVEYRRVLGDLISIYELQAVPGFDLRTIQKLLPYLTCQSSEGLGATLKNRLKQGQQQVILRWSKTLEKSKGFNRELPVHFLGDDNQLYFRYRYQAKLLQYGLVAEKDKGEQFFKGAQAQGFDFYSFHFFIKRIRKIKSLALGDYVINLGQGLVHWQSMGAGKGMLLLNSKREGPVLMPYRSAGEFNFLRGAAIQLGFKNFDITAFVSYRKFSANTNDSSESFSAFNSTGLHRTENEMGDRNKVSTFTVGTSLQLSGWKGKLGFNIINYNISKALSKNNVPYNYFMNGGKSLYFISIDYAQTFKNFHFYGEAAMDKSGHPAFTNGMVISLDATADLALHYRNISKGYFPLFGNAFTEGSIPVNEEGMFIGAVLRPLKGFEIHAYCDVYSFPWLRYRVDAPSKGREFLLSLEFQPSRQSSILILYRSKQKPINTREGNFNYPELQFRQSLRLHITREINKILAFRSRFELSSFHNLQKEASQGWMMYMESIYKRNHWQSAIRMQWFDTDNDNTRIYSYESDVLFSSSILPVYDKGLRYYFNTRFEFNTSLSLSARMAQTILKEKSSVGSGYNTISGNRKTDIRIQFICNF